LALFHFWVRGEEEKRCLLKRMTYKEAGVDINAGDKLVDLIMPMAKSTHRPELLDGVGGFAGLIEYPGDPQKLLAACTDGVGTKLLLALHANQHQTVGIDLVAMCVNDLICVGAKPLLFLDYYASAKLSPEQAAQVVSGIAEGCRQAGCVLLGGETAELPGMYPEKVYDLAGFAVGTLSRSEMLLAQNITPGDVVLGVASSGFHSNGYSLVRRVFAEHLSDEALVKQLLEPTVIYVSAVNALRAAKLNIKGIAHITGGGLPGNLPRVLPNYHRAKVQKGSWKIPDVFHRLATLGNVEENEMLDTFNCGIGLCVILPKEEAAQAQATLQAHQKESFLIGEIEASQEEEPVVFLGGNHLFGKII
jgi:phosphoribosylformylglycinamidine cyclo-ligase